MNYAHKATIELNRNDHLYDVIIAGGSLGDAGVWARNCLKGSPGKIVVVSNDMVFELYGETVVSSLKTAGFESSVWLMEDGEKYKNFDSLKDLLLFLAGCRLTRTDCVLALGGGVVGDLAGFAAAVYLRGLPVLQVPTTLLSMIDSSVGGKTAVNFESGKNMIGAFHQPSGVLIDVATLKTLERRELAAGFFEAVKQAAVANQELFNRTGAFLEDYPLGNFRDKFKRGEFVSNLEQLLFSHIEFKLDIVKGDETEDAAATDPRSRKILNFGHTVGHALEKVTDFGQFRHGEAVGYGMLAAAELSKKLEFLDSTSLNLLNDVISSVGPLPKASRIKVEDVIEAIGFDKKMIDKSLQWILLEGIGRPVIVRQSEIPQEIIRETLTTILRN